MEKTISEYEQQGIDFLAKTGTEFRAIKLGHFPYFDDDKESRDVYQIILTRGNQVYSFRFGQCTAKSETLIARQKAEMERRGDNRFKVAQIKIEAPNAYDVLATITKYDPGTFSDFCGEFGYDTDSRKAEKIYFAVQEEYKNIHRLFSDVMAELEEIQ